MDTVIRMLKVKQGEQRRAMDYLNAECTCCFATPCPIVGILDLPINVCPISIWPFVRKGNSTEHSLENLLS